MGKHHEPEDLAAPLRQVEVLMGQGQAMAEAVRAIGVDGDDVLPVAPRVWRAEARPRRSRFAQRRGAAAEAAGAGEHAPAPSGRGSHAGEAGAQGSRVGKLLSAPRRRAAVEHVRGKLGVSERFACRALGQPRATQRKAPRTGEDEAALTRDIIALARQYGRYGYRRITALLRAEGWCCNHKRVERIWRRERLRVPPRQPKRGRLFDPLRGPSLRGIAFGDGSTTVPVCGCGRSGRTRLGLRLRRGPPPRRRRSRSPGRAQAQDAERGRRVQPRVSLHPR
jgi:hypothetical protein